MEVYENQNSLVAHVLQNTFFMFPRRKKVRSYPFLPPHLLDSFHLGNVELQHVLDAALQRDDGAGTAGAGTLQLQLYNAILEPPIQHVPTILLHCGPEVHMQIEKRKLLN